jgi:rRNA maturation endonuclease Nob1
MFKRDIYGNNSNSKILNNIPWEFMCPGCGKIVYIMEEIPYESCWRCGTVLTIGTKIIDTKTSLARINYYSTGWSLNDRQINEMVA